VDDLASGFRLKAKAPRKVGAQRLLDYLGTVLAGLVETPEAPLFDVQVLPATELQQQLVDFNASETDYPVD
ncbi:hypothetical protein, partial [Pseudomonas tolaasii]